MNLDLRFFQNLEKEILEMLERHAAELSSGKAQSFDDYRYRVGYIKALKDVLEVARESNRRAIGLDDKEER